MLMPPILTPVEIGPFLQVLMPLVLTSFNRSKMGLDPSLLRLHGC
jgi:hypothetical protein